MAKRRRRAIKPKTDKEMKFRTIISALAICVTATAQETLTLEQCRQMAIQNNKEIKASHEQTQGAEYTAKSYKALYYPNLKLNATGLYSTINGDFTAKTSDLASGITSMSSTATSAISSLATLMGTLHTDYASVIGSMLSSTGASALSVPDEIALKYKVGPVALAALTLEQPIYMGGKIKAANEMAQAGVVMAQTNDTLVKHNVIVEVDNAYSLLVKANEMLKVAKSYNQVLQELMSNVQSAYKNGLKPKNDVMKVSVKLNESELNIHKAENAQRLAAMNLCHVIGLPLDSDINVSSDFPSAEEINITNTTDISARPEYAILDQQVKIAEQQVTIDKSGVRPEVGFMAIGSYVYGGQIEVESKDGNGKKIDSMSKEQTVFNDFNGTFLINVTIPLFHFGENSNKVRASKSKLEKARYEQENKNELMQLQLTQAANILDEAKLEAELSDKNLEQAAENMRLSKKNYEAEMEPLSDYLEAQTLWQQAYQQQVEAHFKLYLSNVDYKKAIGSL